MDVPGKKKGPPQQYRHTERETQENERRAMPNSERPRAETQHLTHGDHSLSCLISEHEACVSDYVEVKARSARSMLRDHLAF